MNKKILKCISAIGFILCIVIFLYAWKKGLFHSQAKLQSFISGFGASGAVIFIIFQAVQVVVPVLPGGISCLAGVLMFGVWKGFFYNYLGICAGSMLAFGVAKCYGKPVLKALFTQKMIEKYETWTSAKGSFAKWFAIAIFFPAAPDDFLCYLAGTTEMAFSRFAAIILLGKPFAIALYSAGLNFLYTRCSIWIGGLAG